MKPAALTPPTTALLAELLLEAGMPPAFLSVLQGSGETVGSWLLEEKDVAFYTFTGSTRVGRVIQDAAGLRRTQMELGSIASTLVCADSDLDRAIPKIANAALRNAGQVFTSVQRLYLDARLVDEVSERLVAVASSLPAGDPRDPQTKVGPLISEKAAISACDSIEEALDRGASLLCGGERSRSVVTPTVLASVADTTRVWAQEAFAPLLAIRPFTDFDAAMASANDTPYGLSAGIFTQDIDRRSRRPRPCVSAPFRSMRPPTRAPTSCRLAGSRTAALARRSILCDPGNDRGTTSGHQPLNRSTPTAP